MVRSALLAAAAIAVVAGCGDDGDRQGSAERLRREAEWLTDTLGRRVDPGELRIIVSPSGGASAVVFLDEVTGGLVCWDGDELIDSPEVQVAVPGTTRCK